MASNVPSGMPPTMNLPAGMPPRINIPAGMPPLPKPVPVIENVQQKPALTRPLPPTGLPSGWTIEQWNAYGNIWLERNQK